MAKSLKNRVEWLPWIGIGAGGLVIIATPFLFKSLSYSMILPLFGAGIIAGALSEGGAKEGLVSGVLALFLGIGLLSIPFLWLNSGTGFAAGLGEIVLIFITILSLPCVIVGGVIGGSVRSITKAKGGSSE